MQATLFSVPHILPVVRFDQRVKDIVEKTGHPVRLVLDVMQGRVYSPRILEEIKTGVPSVGTATDRMFYRHGKSARRALIKIKKEIRERKRQVGEEGNT